MRCQRCGGANTIQGLGWMESDCPSCGGRGSVDFSPRLSETVSESLGSSDVFDGSKPGMVKTRSRKRVSNDQA